VTIKASRTIIAGLAKFFNGFSEDHQTVTMTSASDSLSRLEISRKVRE